MHTKTSGTRPSRRIGFVILLAALAMAIPSSAFGSYGFVSDEGTNQGSAASDTRSRAEVGRATADGLVLPNHEALNDSLGPLSKSHGVPGAGAAPASPVPAPTSSADKFDWADAALGAGIAISLIGLGATVVVRRRMTVSAASAS
jgi:hypothetical protein